MTALQQWLQRPEKSWLRNVFFRIHLWVGAGAGAYILLMSTSISMIVFRNQQSRRFSIERLVNLRENLLSGSTGRLVQGMGAFCEDQLGSAPLFGLVTAALALTGVFICCHRVIFKKHSNPNTQLD
jgi:hypothetical protein